MKSNLLQLLALIVVFLCAVCQLHAGIEKQGIIPSFQEAQALSSQDPKQALQLVNQLLISNKEDTLQNWRIIAYRAKLLIQLRELDQAIQSAWQADSLCSLKNKEPYALAHSILGICYKDKGNLEQSLCHYQLAVDYSTDSLNCIYNVINMSEVSLEAGDTLAVKNYFAGYADYMNRIEPIGARGYVLLQYARFLAQTEKDPRIALPVFLNSFACCRQGEVYDAAGFNCEGITDLYKRLNRIDSCVVWLDSLVYYQEKCGSPLALANAYQCYADFKYDIGDYQAALDEYKRALPYAIEADYRPMLESNLLQLSKTSEKLGDYKSSILYLKKYNQLIDSLGRSRWSEHLSDLQIQYETRKRDLKLKTLEDKLHVALKLPGFLAILFLAVLAVLSYLSSRWVKKARKSQRRPERTKPIVREVAMTDEKIRVWEALQASFQQEKLYVDPELNLNVLAQRLQTNRTTLSELINSQSGKSFNNFVNCYRIKEACRLLKSPKKRYLSIEGIGLETGFKSRSTFYTAFVSEMKVTPAKYRQDCLVEV